MLIISFTIVSKFLSSPEEEKIELLGKQWGRRGVKAVSTNAMRQQSRRADSNVFQPFTKHITYYIPVYLRMNRNKPKACLTIVFIIQILWKEELAIKTRQVNAIIIFWNTINTRRIQLYDFKVKSVTNY